MRISYKQYRNSRLATFLDAMGSLICIIPVFGIVVLLQAVLSDNTNTDISIIDTVGTILVLGFFLGLFFASTFSSKMQIEFLKVAWGISPVLHFLRRHSFRCRRGAVAGIQSLLVTDM